ncbi:MAG: hypothetical protein KA123_02875 [Candidatus Eisenbacteria bacterium]|nr:hypothetical protein [Candidatus Eisenbacteria bacterium]
MTHLHDYAINARVRRVLARHWIDPGSFEVGTTDGVVVMKGRPSFAMEGEEFRDPLRCARMLQRLKSEVAAIPGVNDVVVDLHGGEGAEDACGEKNP